MDRKQQIHVWYFAAAFMLLLLAQSWFSQASVTERIPYSTFLEYLEEDRIAAVTVRAEQVEGRYRDRIDGNTHFVTNIVPPDLTERLERSGAEFGGTVQNTLLGTVLSWVVPILLIFALWSFFLRRVIERQGMGGMMKQMKSLMGGKDQAALEDLAAEELGGDSPLGPNPFAGSNAPPDLSGLLGPEGAVAGPGRGGAGVNPFDMPGLAGLGGGMGTGSKRGVTKKINKRKKRKK